MVNKFYQGKVNKISDSDFRRIAKQYDIPESRLRAVVEVEARGSGYYGATDLLTALYEPHVAYAHSSGEARKALVSAGLAYPKWKRDYPKTSYDRIDKAAKIAGEEVAALATSWGMGQIMGFNHDAVGFSTALEMVKNFAVSEANQVEGMLKFITSKKLLTKLKNGDWKGFAYGYNGAGYAENSYDIKLAAADKKWAVKLNNKDVPNQTELPTVPSITKGAKGEVVKSLQQGLKDLGFDVTVDGDFGGHTEEIVKQFQEQNGLTVDGQAGPATRLKISEALTAKSKDVAKAKKIPVAFVTKPEAKVLLGETAQEPILVEQEELEKPVGRTRQFWYWLSTLPLTGAASWFQDWRVLLGIFVAIVVLAIFGILAQNKLITTYKNIKKALEE